MKHYLEHSWYFAGWSDQLAAGQVKEVILAERSLAVYRGETGEVAAIGNRCPHRFAPLHLGKVKGETLQCGYHGLEFGADGKCVFNPHIGKAEPGSASVRSYSVAERDGAIWVWLSQDRDADPSMLPDMSELVHQPATALIDIPTMSTQADYRLVIDNLLDPTHAEYMHQGVLGGTGELNNNKPTIKVSGSTVQIDWLYEGVIAVPIFEAFKPDVERVDSWNSVRWYAPGVVRFAGGVFPSGQGRDAGPWAVVYHILTPAEENVTNYDVRCTRTFALDDTELTQQMAAALKNAFLNEDKPMIEAQQAMMKGCEFWDLKPILFPTDSPAVRVRRAHDALVQKELSLA